MSPLRRAFNAAFASASGNIRRSVTIRVLRARVRSSSPSSRVRLARRHPPTYSPPNCPQFIFEQGQEALVKFFNLCGMLLAWSLPAPPIRAAPRSCTPCLSLPGQLTEICAGALPLLLRPARQPYLEHRDVRLRLRERRRPAAASTVRRARERLARGGPAHLPGLPRRPCHRRRLPQVRPALRPLRHRHLQRPAMRACSCR